MRPAVDEGVDVLAKVRQAIDALGEAVAELDSACLDGEQALALMKEFARGERIAGAGKAMTAARVDETGAYKRSHQRSAAHLLAKVSGTTVFAADQAIKSAHRIKQLPRTDAALRAGDLSLTQASLVSEAAVADPAAEPRLLASSRADGVRGLRATSAQVLAATVTDANERYERIRKDRAFRHWRDLDGAGRIDVRGPLELTTHVVRTMERFEKELFERAAKRDESVRSDAVMFDALVTMADVAAGADVTPATGTRPTVMVRVDARALASGTLEPGEVCELAGAGPIPVSVAARLADDAFLKVLLTDGVDVQAVSHLGRTIPAALRTALDELYPECAVEGCHQSWGLEIDHSWDLILGGPTALWNLNKLCPFHHQEKHRHDLRLVGAGPRKRFVPAAKWMPPDRDPRARRAPLAAV